MESIDVQHCGQQCQHHEHRDRHIGDAHGRPGPDPQGQDSKTQPTAYAAPRNAAVTGGWMVQAKCCSVLAERTNNTTKASAVSRAAKKRTTAIAFRAEARVLLVEELIRRRFPDRLGA